MHRLTDLHVYMYYLQCTPTKNLEAVYFSLLSVIFQYISAECITESNADAAGEKQPTSQLSVTCSGASYSGSKTTRRRIKV